MHEKAGVKPKIELTEAKVKGMNKETEDRHEFNKRKAEKLNK